MIFKFELTREQLALVADALASMPYGRVADLISELRRQIDTQTKSKVENVNG